MCSFQRIFHYVYAIDPIVYSENICIIPNPLNIILLDWGDFQKIPNCGRLLSVTKEHYHHQVFEYL